MAMNKKGLFFTLTAIMFIIILIFFIEIENKPKLSEKSDVISSRVGTMDSFIKSVEEDTERALYISGFRTLLAMTDSVLINGEYIDNIDLRFNEAFFNGTIDGQPNILITGSTFDDWASSIGIQANKLNILINFQNPIITVYQETPWSIILNLNATISYADLDGTASWNRDTVIISELNLSNFEDPAYTVNTLGRVGNTIEVTPYEGNYTWNDGGTWYVANLKDHLKESYYTFNSDAPNYLMRLEGNLSQASSCCGIESLVNLEKLTAQGIDVYSFSVVDHEYWTNQSGVQITDMQSWFRLDTPHRAKYEVDDAYFDV